MLCRASKSSPQRLISKKSNPLSIKLVARMAGKSGHDKRVLAKYIMMTIRVENFRGTGNL
jgi:hypothetical protein